MFATRPVPIEQSYRERVSGNQTLRFATPTFGPGQCVVTLSGDPSEPGGDADLYVAVGREPSFADFDCRPYLDGSGEICRVPVAQPAEVHVMVHGYAAQTSAFQLALSCTPAADRGPLRVASIPRIRPRSTADPRPGSNSRAGCVSQHA